MISSRLLACSFALVVFAFWSPAVGAVESPCGAVLFDEGTINIDHALALDDPISDKTRACMGELAKLVKSRREIRSVTVVVRASDKLRTSGGGIRVARAYMKALVQGGVSEHRVSAVSPGTAPGEPDAVLLTYTQKRAAKPVGVVTAAFGEVSAGKSSDAMTPVKKGQTISSYTYLTTGEKSVADLTLADGSFIEVAPQSQLLFGRMWLNEKMERAVRINLMKGNFSVDITKGGASSMFDVVTPNAIAGVRGTKFRIYYDGDSSTRLETLDGTVEFKGAGGTVWVKKAQGSLVGKDGSPTAPRPLLMPCEMVSPLKGDVAAGAQLKWKPINGAARYRVFVARDAEFTTGSLEFNAAQPKHKLNAEVGAGKWFWRVVAVDASGFSGLPSKIYSFQVK